MKKIIILIIITLGLSSCGIKEYVLKEKEIAKWEGINNSLTTLEKEGFPYSDDLSFFIDKTTIEQSLMTLVGTNVYYRKKGYFQDWRLNIDNVELNSNDGFISAILEITAFNSKDKRKANLELITQITVSDILQSDKKNTDILELKLIPLSIKPKVYFLGLPIGLSKKHSQDLADLTTYLNKSHFASKIPITNSVKQALELVEDGHTEKIYSDKEKDWYYELKYSTERKELIKYISLNSPVFAKEGIIISAKLTDKKEPFTWSKIPPPDSNIEELKKKNIKLQQKLNSLITELDYNQSESSIFFNKRIFVDYLNLLNPVENEKKISADGLINFETKIKLPSKKTSVSINSFNSKGYLAESKSDNEILGLVSLFVELNGDDAIKSNISINQLKQSWIPNKGINFQLAMSAELSAKIKAFLGPSVGLFKGLDLASLSVKLEGSTSPSIKGNIQFTNKTIDGKKTLLLMPNLECDAIPIKVETDGKWAWETGWTKVPKIGVTFKHLLGDDFIEPIPILSESRSYSEEKSSGISSDGLEIIKDYKYLIFSIEPNDLQINENGINISLSPTITKTNDLELIKSINMEQLSFQKAIKDFYVNQTKNCPNENDILVHLGSLEFGKNNDIIKFIVNGWNDIVNGPGDNNDIVKLINNIGGLVNESTPIDDISINSIKEIERFASRNLGKNNEATKALRNLGNEMEKIKNNPGKAIGDLPSNVIKEGKKAVNKITKHIGIKF
jgi:hypothetical protein